MRSPGATSPLTSSSQFATLAMVVAGAILVASNQYGATYQDSYEHQPEPSYGGGHSYPQPAAPAYHAAPSYPKYNAPSSAHHTQYDNYYPKQTYSKPMYSAPKPASYAPQPMYRPQPQYQARPSYPMPSYGSQYEAPDYRARA